VHESHSKAENLNFVMTKQAEHAARDPSIAVDYIMIMDADHMPAPGALAHAVGLLEADQSAAAVQGCCTVDISRSADDWRSQMLATVIACEYAEIYSLHHAGGAHVRGFGLFGGSDAVWRAPVITGLQFDGSMLTEDIDLSMRALRAGHRVIYSNAVVSYEEAPPSLAALFRQRVRWVSAWSHNISISTLSCCRG
jgi:cellulose synthase/poly-beta-1,6-N-acetylglucosamine synthase-like glycosyltransferase